MKSNFQTILVIIFAAAFGIAVIVFSGLFSSKSSQSTTTPQGTVEIWGILPRDAMQAFIDGFNIANNGYSLSYTEHAPDTFKQEVINALADGTQPDIVIINSELFSGLKDKLYITPYTAYPERTYRDTNIDGAQIFLNKDGVVLQPLVVDPLVVYYNKDILSKSNFVIPPTTWTNLQQSIRVLTKKDTRNAITQSTIALGGAQNIQNFRDIISALFFQAGVSIATYDPATDHSVVTLMSGTTTDTADLSTAQALSFYTSFSNPTNTNYSWNNALPNSLAMFVAGKSAFYIGRASELFAIQTQNPNLNFDVKELFKTTADTRSITFGSFVGVGILKQAPNLTAAYPASTIMTSKDAIDNLSKRLSLAPARRDLLLVPQTNPYVSVFFRAALNAFAWPDPDPVHTTQIFRDMITDITSGRADPTTAINNAARNLQSSIR